PFDRERAERIGADAIVSKPFDSQQLIAQVDALLDRGPSGEVAAAKSGVTAPMPAVTAQTPSGSDEAPLPRRFPREDFTAAVRIPPRGLDPLEEEYVRGDVDSAIEAFEKPHPRPAAPEEPEAAISHEEPISTAEPETGREAPPPWLPEEPEKVAEAEPMAAPAEPSLAEEFASEVRENSESTVAIQMPSADLLPFEESAKPEHASAPPIELASEPEKAPAPERFSEHSPEHDVFELPPEVAETPRVAPASSSIAE